LPENLLYISCKAFRKSYNIKTITKSSVSYTLENGYKGFKNMLVDAGFTPGDPNEILCGKAFFKRGMQINKGTVFYDRKKWAGIISVDGRFPLVTAAVRSRKWEHMQEIFDLHMPVIQNKDVLTGMPLFMLAAIGQSSDIESIYNLLKEYPSAIQTDITILP